MDAALQVATYDALWFLIPLASLVLAMVRPRCGPRLSRRGDRLDPSPRARRTLVSGSLVLGGYLVVKGTARLLT